MFAVLQVSPDMFAVLHGLSSILYLWLMFRLKHGNREFKLTWTEDVAFLRFDTRKSGASSGICTSLLICGFA